MQLGHGRDHKEKSSYFFNLHTQIHSRTFFCFSSFHEEKCRSFCKAFTSHNVCSSMFIQLSFHGHLQESDSVFRSFSALFILGAIINQFSMIYVYIDRLVLDVVKLKQGGIRFGVNCLRPIIFSRSLLFIKRYINRVKFQVKIYIRVESQNMRSEVDWKWKLM